MFKETIVKAHTYDSIKQRKDIIIKWSLEYGRMFQRCSIQIIPYVDIQRVKKDGNNFGNGKKYDE